MSEPLVSIVLPTYNRATLLPRALDSIVAQTVEDWEILLIDDGSTDETRAVADRYARQLGDRFRYLEQPQTGCGAARNRGLARARGTFVAFLDSDDEFLPTKLERQLELFKLRPELGLVYSDYAYVDLDGHRHESVFDTLGPTARKVEYETVGPNLCVCKGSIFDLLLREYFISTIVGMVRREVIGDSIRWSPDPSYSAEWLFYLKVAHCCSAGFVDEPLCLHHFVARSVTRTSPERNLVRLRQLLSDMESTFDDLTKEQQSVVRSHRARTSRQLGYARFTHGDWRQASLYLSEVFRCAPSLRSFYDLAQVKLRSGWSKIAGRRVRAGKKPERWKGAGA